MEDVPMSDLTIVRRSDYTVDANWKLLAENFME